MRNLSGGATLSRAPTCWEASTGNINDTFNTIDALLKDEMDVLLMPYQFTHADFYNEYRSARSIVDTEETARQKRMTRRLINCIWLMDK